VHLAQTHRLKQGGQRASTGLVTSERVVLPSKEVKQALHRLTYTQLCIPLTYKHRVARTHVAERRTCATSHARMRQREAEWSHRQMRHMRTSPLRVFDGRLKRSEDPGLIALSTKVVCMLVVAAADGTALCSWFPSETLFCSSACCSVSASTCRVCFLLLLVRLSSPFSHVCQLFI
jgi:hypothetical protein